MRTISRLWNGDMPLQDAFWIWAVLGGLAVNVVTSLLFVWLMMAEQPALAILGGYGLSLPYNTLALVGVWRSADRFSGDRRLAEAMRMITVIGLVLLSVT